MFSCEVILLYLTTKMKSLLFKYMGGPDEVFILFTSFSQLMVLAIFVLLSILLLSRYKWWLILLIRRSR